jgi:3-methyladenine DNA glycosylase Tag
MAIQYDWLYQTARKRFESEQAFEDFLPQCLSDEQLKAKSDGEYLSAMTQRVFQAGMTHSVVNARWPAFEKAFWGFEPEKMVLLSPEQIEQFAQDKTLIRHLTKMRTIPENAQMILNIYHETHKHFGEFLADWSVSDTIGLWKFLAKRGSRLGGRSAAGFLRLAGKDTFILSSDVVARLIANGIINTPPTSQADLLLVQNAFNDLQQQSGRPLCQLSSMLALSIHPTF